MRRESIDLSYKERSKEIIRSNYKEWQLAYNNNRELAHVLTNRLVSIADDLYSEIDYVENMFFPDRMDINEEWLVYETIKEIEASNILLSGSPLSEYLTKASTIDEFISGPYDHFDIISSGEPGFSMQYSCCTNDGIAFISDNYVTVINPDTGITTMNRAYPLISGEVTIYVNSGNYDYPFTTEMESVTVYNKNGDEVSCEYITQASCTGNYSSKNDYDSNGVINKTELETITKYRDRSSSEFEPEEWDKLKWMDVDGDGTIGIQDYKYLTSSIPSMRGDIKSSIALPVGSVGEHTVSYIQKVPKSAILLPLAGQYKIVYNNEPLAEIYSKLAYDEATRIAYGINKTDGMVYAIRLDDTYSIVATARIYLDTDMQQHEIIDLAMHNGYIFVLTSYSGKYYLYYEDTRKEFIEYINRKAHVEISEGHILTGLTIDRTGYFYFHNETILYRVKAHRNKYIEMNNKVFMNIDHQITNTSGDPVLVVPWNIFNSFDSFAFSFGIERPAGCDNIKMKELIYDFWKFRQDNSAIGINYGMKRELGITNTPNSFDTIKYILPADIDTTGDIIINGETMVKTMGQNIVSISGVPGSFILSGTNILIPDDPYYLTNTDIRLQADFIDGNGDTQNLEYRVILTDHYTTPDIEVYSLGDPLYVNSERCIYSEDEVVAKIEEMEYTDPFIYKNMITDIYPLNASRVSSIPMLPTTYGISIQSGDDVIINI